MKKNIAFTMVHGDRVRYNKTLHHNTLKFDLNDPEQFEQCMRLVFTLLEQMKGHMTTTAKEFYDEEEGEE